MLFPWQQDIWQQIQKRKSNLPHAILLQGRAGIGKYAFARTLAQGLLCENPLESGLPCDACAACGWFSQANHPDFRQVEPEALSQASESGEEVKESDADEKSSGKKASIQIKVSQVRDLADFVNLSTHRSGMRVILIHPAEALNLNTANALLKTLEEPPPHTLFILITHQAHRLLPTIRSRCQKLDMPLPANELAMNWLKEQGVQDATLCLAQASNAPLAALELSTVSYQDARKAFVAEISKPAVFDPLQAAETYQKSEMSTIVNWLQKWVYDLISCKLTGEVQYHPDFSDNLQDLCKSVNLSVLLSYQRELAATQRVINHPLNPLLQLENLFVSYTKTFELGDVRG